MLEMREEVRFDVERFGSEARYFVPETLDRITAEWREDLDAERVRYLLRGVVASWTEDHYLRVPADGWEVLKDRWFPDWALSRWPVQFRVYDAAVILPRVPLPRPEYGAVTFSVWRERDDLDEEGEE